MDDNIKKASATSDNDEFADIKNEIRNRYELLPESLKQALMDDGYQQKLFDIAKANKLTYEELSILEMETTMVLLGMSVPSNYRDELQIQLKKNDDVIEPIVKAVNEQVFGPLRETLMRLYETNPEVTVGGVEIMPENQTSQTEKAEENLSSAEKTVLAKTGVEVSEAPKQNTVPQATEPDRKAILAGIENPPRMPSRTIVADKLGSSKPVIPGTKTTDYSVNKPVQPTTPQANTPLSHASDPYREPIE